MSDPVNGSRLPGAYLQPGTSSFADFLRYRLSGH